LADRTGYKSEQNEPDEQSQEVHEQNRPVGVHHLSFGCTQLRDAFD